MDQTLRLLEFPQQLLLPIVTIVTRVALFILEPRGLHSVDYGQLPVRLGTDSYLESLVNPAEPLTSVRAVGARYGNA